MEFVRHRVFSFAQESTRYCNYSKDKFGNELTFIIPCWMQLKEGKYEFLWDEGSEHEYGFRVNDEHMIFDSDTNTFLHSLLRMENNYILLIKNNWKPQQARAILPNSLKTELIMTGFVSDWIHFFKLRNSDSAHPQARELAKPLYEEFIKRGLC